MTTDLTKDTIYQPDTVKLRSLMKAIQSRKTPLTPDERVDKAHAIGDMCLEQLEYNVVLGQHKGNLTYMDLLQKSLSVIKGYLELRTLQRTTYVDEGAVQRIELVIPIESDD